MALDCIKNTLPGTHKFVNTMLPKEKDPWWLQTIKVAAIATVVFVVLAAVGIIVKGLILKTAHWVHSLIKSPTAPLSPFPMPKVPVHTL